MVIVLQACRIMRHMHDRRRDLRQIAAQLHPRDDIKARERLVQHDHTGGHGDDGHEADKLLLPVGQAVGGGIGPVGLAEIG